MVILLLRLLKLYDILCKNSKVIKNNNVKNINKCLFKYINSKARAKESLHSILDVAGCITKRKEEKEEDEHSMPSLLLSLIIRLVILRVLFH